MSKNYNTRTASLKATIADVRNLDAKKIVLDGKDVLERISDAEFTSYDTRDPLLRNDELDIWNTKISLSDNGHIEVKPLKHTFYNLSDEQIDTITGIKSAIKVIDNEVLGDNDTHLLYWLTDGFLSSESTFSRCTNLTSFTSNLSSLTYGEHMFYGCTNLTTFSSDLSSLTRGACMFLSCTNLASFTSDLSSLTDGTNMFVECSKLTIFSFNLPNLKNGYAMFYKAALTSFFSDLSSLTSGAYMFAKCKLDATSVANIIHTLPIHTSSGLLDIGIGCDNTEADQLLFAQECDCDTWQELLDDFTAKNWTVTFQCNGRPTATYNMRRGETLPIYAKLEEVTDEKYAQYTSTDGSKFYNINYFHSTNGPTEGYDIFPSLEEAIATYNVTPKN